MGSEIKKTHAYFPFLKDSQDLVKENFNSIEDLVNGPRGQRIRDLTLQRITKALLSHDTSVKLTDISQQALKEEIICYGLARVIVSCINNKFIMDRLARYESERVYSYLINEGSEDDNAAPKLYDGYTLACLTIAKEIGIDYKDNSIPFRNYVECTAPLHDIRWKLINRKLSKGSVKIFKMNPEDGKDELIQLIRERVRVVLRQELPKKVPKKLCELFSSEIEKVNALFQQLTLQEFGTIEESAFPPCMQALLSALKSGVNLTHAGRFSLTAFLHGIGMNSSAIAEVYARSPDFDPEKTMYQVEHITGREGSGVEYNAPACPAMETTGICVNKDKMCERVNHPLSYYKKRKFFLSKQEQNEKKEI